MKIERSFTVTFMRVGQGPPRRCKRERQQQQYSSNYRFRNTSSLENALPEFQISYEFFIPFSF